MHEAVGTSMGVTSHASNVLDGFNIFSAFAKEIRDGDCQISFLGRRMLPAQVSDGFCEAPSCLVEIPRFLRCRMMSIRVFLQQGPAAPDAVTQRAERSWA